MTETTRHDDDIASRKNYFVKQVGDITRLLYTGVMVSAAAIIARITAGGDGVTLPWGVRVAFSDVWLILVALTCGHVFLAVFLVNRLHRARREMESKQDRIEIVKAVTEDGSVFVRGLETKLTYRGPFIGMSHLDQSMWVAYLSALSLFPALLPWHLRAGHVEWGSLGGYVAMLVIALVLIAVNWITGTRWRTALAELAMDREEAGFRQWMDQKYPGRKDSAETDIERDSEVP